MTKCYEWKLLEIPVVYLSYWILINSCLMKSSFFSKDFASILVISWIVITRVPWCLMCWIWDSSSLCFIFRIRLDSPMCAMRNQATDQVCILLNKIFNMFHALGAGKCQSRHWGYRVHCYWWSLQVFFPSYLCDFLPIMDCDHWSHLQVCRGLGIDKQDCLDLEV